MTDRLTDSNQKTDRMTESTVKSTYFVPAVKYRGGEWWVVMGWGQKARLLSGIGNTTTQICPMYHIVNQLCIPYGSHSGLDYEGLREYGLASAQGYAQEEEGEKV